ncbi:EAL domain-containing protein [Primorskyibacter sp. S87]|uniref:EAL domain-containing protein n=1 Tax=Primorskyibacter sp. S87 TaxID=3415126 RepID=UPI003C7D866B
MKQRHRNKPEIPAGRESPLNAAVAGRDREVLEMVDQAIRQNQCRLAYQPVMQARPPHGAAFHEGFIRVLDATGRVIPARDFMPAVENDELGRELDCNALRMGLRTLARHPEIRLAINMSARSIGYRRWAKLLQRSLKNDPSIGERLILEIGESSAMLVPELVIDIMDQLQKSGVAFTLDDFGAGNMAFRHLREFFFDAEKIDGQFVRGVSRNPDNQSVARALVAVAKEFDMFVIAESVETQEDAEFLVSIGVDCLQGFLFGAPAINPTWSETAQLRKQSRST